MTLFTADELKRLSANGIAQQRASETGAAYIDFEPVVKLFTPDANATWLLTEIIPGDPDLAFGLCDLGLGAPELGYVTLMELKAIRGPLGLPVERDRHFEADKPLSAYHAIAAIRGRIDS